MFAKTKIVKACLKIYLAFTKNIPVIAKPNTRPDTYLVSGLIGYPVSGYPAKQYPVHP
jgi:hypothetical protein